MSGISVKGMRMRMLLADSRRKRPMPNTKVMYRPVMPNDDTVAPMRPLCTRSRIATSLQMAQGYLFGPTDAHHRWQCDAIVVRPRYLDAW